MGAMGPRLLLIAVCVLSLCAGRAHASGLVVRPVESRIDAIPGQELVFEVELDGEVPEGNFVVAKLADGRAMRALLIWIGQSPSGSAVRGWLPPAPVFATFGQEADVGRGAWHCVVSLPEDALGQAIWIGRTRITPNWLPNPTLALREILGVTRTTERPWERPDASARLADEPLATLALQQRSNPELRWRWLLLEEGLAPPKELPPLGLAGLLDWPGTMPDPVLEAAARLTESRWRAALALLWRDDPALAERLKNRLTAVIEVAPGVVVPVWPTDTAALASLLDDLTDRGATVASRQERARVFLGSGPAMTARVAGGSAGGPIDAELTSLRESATLGWVRAGDVAPTPEPVSAMSTVPMQTLAGAEVEAVELALGSDAVRCGVLPPTAVVPPGAPLGPFVQQLTRSEWLTPCHPGSAPAAAWQTTALLYLDGDTWTLLVECRKPEGDAGATATRPVERLRLWIDGGLIEVDERGTEGIVTEDRGDRWVAFVPVADAAAGENHTLRLAVERVDSLGRRSTWPRPVTPWQAEPGVAVLDLSQWSR